MWCYTHVDRVLGLDQALALAGNAQRIPIASRSTTDGTAHKHRDTKRYHDALQSFIGGKPDFDRQASKLHRFCRLTSRKIMANMVIERVKRRADGVKVSQQRHALWHEGLRLAVQAEAALFWDQRFWTGAANRGNRGSSGGDVDKLRQALGIMPSSLGVGEDFIGFHDVLEGRGAWGTDAVRMIEFGQRSLGMQGIQSRPL